MQDLFNQMIAPPPKTEVNEASVSSKAKCSFECRALCPHLARAFSLVKTNEDFEAFLNVLRIRWYG
jgi:hypothetical protein